MLDFKSNEGVDDQFIITFENVRTNNACELVQTLFLPPQRKVVWVATLALVIDKNIAIYACMCIIIHECISIPHTLLHNICR